MDYRDLINFHLKKKADLTVAAVETHKQYSKEFGVMQINADAQIVGFQEKPSVPKTIPNKPDAILINMGVYVFNVDILVKRLIENAKRKDTQHDIAKNVIPSMVKKDRVFAFQFQDQETNRPGYWKDVGTIEAYWEASIDLLAEKPGFDFHDPQWPIYTNEERGAPAKIEGFEEKNGIKYGLVIDSIVSRGCYMHKARVERSILSPNVTIGEYAVVQNSIVMNDCTIGKGCKIKRAIIDKRIHIPDNTEIGYNQRNDAKRFDITASGIVVVPVYAVF
jgi:glucose-1-phosphate adenylyltransferase